MSVNVAPVKTTADYDDLIARLESVGDTTQGSSATAEVRLSLIREAIAALRIVRASADNGVK